MRQKRAELVNKAKDLNTKAKKEKRNMTEEEQKQFDDYLKEAADLKNKIEREETLLGLDGELSAPLNTVQKPQPQNQGQTDEQTQYKNAFFKAIRGQVLNQDESSIMQKFNAKLSEGAGEDGGFVVPEDITTTINELKNTQDNLEQYVTVEPVKTNKGARTLERRADSTPFAPLSEYGNPNAMAEIASPKFDRLSYAIEDYAGFLPAPNDLLDDSDQALEEYLKKWIAKKSKATRNSLILAVLNSLAKVTWTDYKGIKTAINVDLDPAHAEVALIFTNQDGFNYLDQLEDNNGKPLLQEDPQDPTRKLLAGRRIVVLSNKTIPTVVDGTAGTSMAPFIVGDLKEAVVLWDRKQMSLDMTKEGGNSWRTNTTEFRAIEREDVTSWDEEAVVYGQINIA
ncbi:phage major capsid protein [Radiobacillus kanasensis]|uniref:phage major capsid protein n=1 Tax=Radiobacillus kanasensis TaxID=2844358 RepID=UPI0038B63874